MSEITFPDLKDKLGNSKVDHLLRHVTRIQQYLWEQTFALCLYSRSCYVANDHAKAQDFAMRIRMFNALTHFNMEKNLRVTLMEMLSRGESCPKIAGVYREAIERDHSSELMEEVSDSRVRELEETLAMKSITFTTSQDKHPYSFMQMHMSICNPLALFQQLLLLPPPETFILEVSQTVFAQGTDPFKKLTDAVLTQLEYVSRELVVNPQSNDIHQHFQDKVRVKNKETELMITIDRSYLGAIKSIGEFDAFMEALMGTVYAAEEIAEKNSIPFFQGGPSTIDYSNSSDVLKMMSSWQYNNGMGLVKRLDGCPRILASILSFDLEHAVGLFDEKLITEPQRLNSVGNREITSRDMKVEAISGIVEDFLVGTSTDLRPTYNRSKTIKLNYIMEKWTSQNGSVVELYKKLPTHLIPGPKNGSVKSPYKRIAEQMANREKNPKIKLPIGSRLLMPLWSTFQSTQPSTTSEEPVDG